MKGTFNSLLDYVILLTPSTTVVLNFVLKKNLISKLDFGFYCAISSSTLVSVLVQL